MKHVRSLFYLLAGWVLSAQAVTGQEPVDAKALARQALATRSAAQEVLTALEALAGVDAETHSGVVEALAEHMLTDVPVFSTRDAGRVPAQQRIQSLRQDAFSRRVEAAVSRASEQSPLPLNREQVLSQAAPDWAARRDRGAEAYARDAMATVYPAARALAVERLQAVVTAAQAYPGMQELDARLLELDAGRGHAPEPLDAAAFTSLVPWLSTFAAAGGPVFEEMSGFMDERSGAVRDEILRQYRAQRGVMDEEVLHVRYPRGLLTRADMEAHLVSKLEREIDERPGARPPVYGVFTAVKRLASDAAARGETRQLDQFLESSGVWRLSNEALLEILRADPEAYIDAGGSVEPLVRVWLDRVRDAVAEAYAGQGPAERREELRGYFQNGFTQDERLRGVLRDRIEAVVAREWPAVREQFAGEQMRTHFASLMENTKWPESIIADMVDRGQRAAAHVDEVLERLASEPALAAHEAESSRLIDETRARVLARFNEQAEPGTDSLGRQLALIRALESDWMERLRADVQRGEPVERVVRAWTREWEQRWGRESGGIPSVWRPMFERTRGQLNKTVRQLYESVETAQEAAAVAETTAPDRSESDLPTSAEMMAIDRPTAAPGEEGEPMDDDMGEGEGENVDRGISRELRAYRGVADGVMAFSDLPDGQCRLLFGAPDGSGAVSLEFDPARIEESAEAIVQALTAPLREVLDGAEGRQPRRGLVLFRRSRESELSMLFRVDSPLIRHQMSIQVRRGLEEEIQRWAEETGRPAPKLVWQEDVGTRL